MSNKKNRRKPTPAKKHQDSVFKEAWENMNEDMARILPGFLVKRLQGSKGKVWVMVTITVVELLVLGAVGKLAYDWFTK
jgi:hypothetical protein